jgi:hypothetical protein
VTWGFLWIMLVLKIPLAALLWLVWWAIHQEAEPGTDGSPGDGGTKVRSPHRPPPSLGPFPRRRGPHGDPTPAAPPRVRSTVVARSHQPEQR